MGNSLGNHRDPLGASLFTLRFFGLWSSFDDSHTIKKIVYSIYSMMMTSLIWIFIGTMLGDLMCNLQDLLIITDDGCFLAGISVIVFKHMIFCTRRRQIIKLIDDIYSPVDHLAKSSDEGVQMLVNVSTLYDQLHCYSFIGIGCTLVLALITIVPTDNGSLPIRAKYPFDSTIDPLHTIAFAIQAGAVATGVAGILGMDGVVTSICRYITLQLEILDSNYRHCQTKWPRGGFHSSVKKRKNLVSEIRCFIPFSPREVHEANDSFEKRFKICIRHHQRIINIVNNVNVIFGSSMFCQLFASSSMICFTGFQAALGARGSANLIKFAMYCGTAFSQLLSWCLIGNMLLHQSLTLSDSQWQSGWEDEQYFRFAYLLIFSMVRGHTCLELKAINFYSVSMDTFIVILRASYSFFTLLVTVA
ncbi:odorant receptor 4-like isoform X2 [Diachasmimorpha longicaudata]|uniref:odorant receptor 4-like isoform X2 n=1 Tax=Diachasmimorpha longicaudata TaxID=58733 RepID=UPI0030B8AE08